MAAGCAAPVERSAPPTTLQEPPVEPAGAEQRTTVPDPAAPTSLPHQTALSLAVLLAEVEVAAEHRSGYDRGDWAHWNAGTVPDDGLDTRGEVLADQSLCPVGISGGRVRSGCWISVYDGGRFENAAELDIDHIVALGEAHDSGGWQWTAAQREEFANWPGALIAVSAASNRSKKAADPAEWMPPDATVHCEYLVSWTLTKAVWGLSMDPAEHDTIAQHTDACEGAGLLFELITAAAEGSPAGEPTP